MYPEPPFVIVHEMTPPLTVAVAVAAVGVNGMDRRVPSFEPSALEVLVCNALYTFPVRFGVTEKLIVPYLLYGFAAST
jgi:hypothetical protein